MKRQKSVGGAGWTMWGSRGAVGLLLPSLASAAQLDVGPGAPYATIMAAHADAVDGDVISVAPGTFDEAFDLTTGVTLVSTGGSAVTRLTRSAGTLHVVRIANDVTLTGFEIDGGSALKGIEVSGAHSVTLDDVWVHDAVRGMSMWEGDLLVRDSVFEDCSGGSGGALFLDRVDSVRIEGSTFARNTSTGDGGAIRAYYGSSLTIDSSWFVDNTAALFGGAVRPYGVGQVTIRASTFEGNQAAGDGGAIQASTTLGTPAQSVVVRRSWFAGNTSAGGSGGAYHGGDDNNRSLHLLAENRFVDNQAPVGLGGAVFVENDGHVGYYGLHRTKVGVRDNTFVANEAAGGAHLYLTSRVTHAVANNVFAAAGSGSFAVVLHTAPGVVDYNLWFDNAGGDLSGVPLGSHDVFANPLFVAWTDDGDPSNDDLHLQPGSPAVDAGHPSLLDPDLSPSDIGYTAAGLP